MRWGSQQSLSQSALKRDFVLIGSQSIQNRGFEFFLEKSTGRGIAVLDSLEDGRREIALEIFFSKQSRSFSHRIFSKVVEEGDALFSLWIVMDHHKKSMDLVGYEEAFNGGIPKSFAPLVTREALIAFMLNKQLREMDLTVRQSIKLPDEDQHFSVEDDNSFSMAA